MPLLDKSTLGPARLEFSDEKDVDAFVDTLGRFERSEITPEEWKAFRLVNGVYTQRQSEELMMVRVKIPQGILSPLQLRTLAVVAERYSTGRGHLTTRQNLQFHFVPLARSGEVVRLVAEAGLTTREACGNAVRNVTGCPFAGASALEPFDTSPYAEAVTRHLLRGPLSSTLPRKFKIAFGGCCGFDCVGASFNDVGFLARLRDGRPGFRVTLGGGLSTQRRAGILAHEFLPAEEAVEVAEAVVRLFHRTGDRKNRMKARLKFVVDKLGPDEFLREYLVEREQLRAEGRPAAQVISEPPVRTPKAPPARATRPGLAEFTATNVREQRDAAYVAVTVRAPLGDLSVEQLRALAQAVEEYSEEGELRTTVNQNVLLRFVRREHLPSLHAFLDGAQLARAGADTVSDVTSCPGAFSCRLAVTASRHLAQDVTRALEARPALVLRVGSLPIKVSGCPNGCGQHAAAGIGLQGSLRKVDGRGVPQYFVYLGGGFGDGTASFGRLAAKVPARRLPEAIERLVDLAAREKVAGESAAAFLARATPERIDELLHDLTELLPGTARPEDFVDLDGAVGQAADAA